MGIGMTGGEDRWEVRACEVIPVAEIHDIFFVFRSDSDESLCCFDSWKFIETRK